MLCDLVVGLIMCKAEHILSKGETLILKIGYELFVVSVIVVIIVTAVSFSAIVTIAVTVLP